MTVLKTCSAAGTEELGRVLGGLLLPGDVICLSGELGAGKTVFARGVARGLGVGGAVTSPTFTLINEYTGRLPFYHLDVYRLGGAEEMDDLGYAEYFYGSGVTVVEWAERVAAVLPEERLEIYIAPGKDGSDAREIVFSPRGGRYRRLVEELKALVCTGD